MAVQLVLGYIPPDADKLYGFLSFAPRMKYRCSRGSCHLRWETRLLVEKIGWVRMSLRELYSSCVLLPVLLCTWIADTAFQSFVWIPAVRLLTYITNKLDETNVLVPEYKYTVVCIYQIGRVAFRRGSNLGRVGLRLLKLQLASVRLSAQRNDYCRQHSKDNCCYTTVLPIASWKNFPQMFSSIRLSDRRVVTAYAMRVHG